MGTGAASRAVVGSFVALAVVFGLAACSGSPAPAPSGSTSPSSAPTDEPSAEPTPDPTLRPDGSALQNLDYFAWVLERAEENGAKTGSAFIRALEDAGFDRGDMELTPSRTAIDLEADSIQFAVKINGTCLLGQYGNVGLRTAAMPLLETGRCLIGTDRQV